MIFCFNILLLVFFPVVAVVNAAFCFNKDFDARNSLYLGTSVNLTLYRYIYKNSITITNKGNDMEYNKVLEIFVVIDFSSNRFEGDIAECIGNLRGLQALNLSNNMLIGSIPPSLSNMTQLESLALSRNKLSGKIPQQLVQLTFLEFFDVSSNRLQGRIPQGTQFSTFDSSSYEGNLGLWGYPLQSLNTPRAPSSVPEVVPGFVGGLIFGVAMEQFLAMDKREWFIKALDFVAVIKAKGRKRH